MSKNKLYILISLITLICFLGTAALCNQIGDGQDEAPTIKLEIYEGPIFSEEDQVCYYEIEAIVAGTPEPDIEFTLDDNVSLLATEKARVVLNDSSDTYTLNVTAINSEGTTSASMNLSWGCEEEVVSEEGMEEFEEETTEDEEEADEDGEEEIQEGEVLEGDPFPPELSIYIHDGPFYSAADNVCYYIIASEMYGNPYPKLTWSKNDSSSMPAGMTQVNLREGETYTLTATASSVEGTVTRTIDLRWGCDGEEVADGDGDDEEDNVISNYSIPLVDSESGNIRFSVDDDSWDFSGTGSNYIFVGEIGQTGVGGAIGFLSFDISSLEGVKVLESKLLVSHSNDIGNTSRYNKFYIGSMHWGVGQPGRSELDGTVLRVIAIFSSELTNISFSNTALNEELQKAIDSGWNRFQMKLYFSGTTVNDDGIADGRFFEKNKTYLKIDYEEG